MAYFTTLIHIFLHTQTPGHTSLTFACKLSAHLRFPSHSLTVICVVKKKDYYYYIFVHSVVITYVNSQIS